MKKKQLNEKKMLLQIEQLKEKNNTLQFKINQYINYFLALLIFLGTTVIGIIYSNPSEYTKIITLFSFLVLISLLPRFFKMIATNEIIEHDNNKKTIDKKYSELIKNN